jgi:hypothetical protein
MARESAIRRKVRAKMIDVLCATTSKRMKLLKLQDRVADELPGDDRDTVRTLVDDLARYEPTHFDYNGDSGFVKFLGECR